MQAGALSEYFARVGMKTLGGTKSTRPCRADASSKGADPPRSIIA